MYEVEVLTIGFDRIRMNSVAVNGIEIDMPCRDRLPVIGDLARDFGLSLLFSIAAATGQKERRRATDDQLTEVLQWSHSARVPPYRPLRRERLLRGTCKCRDLWNR